jgi:hypothetical protein
MDSTDEQILRASKEIIVKFIELGRVFPTGFHDAFINIYSTVREAVKGGGNTTDPEQNPEK